MKISDLKILFMGTPQIAADVLSTLINGGIRISNVITRPDKPKGRGKEITESPVKVLAQKNDIPVFQPLNKAELTEMVEEIKPDLVVVAAFGMMLPEAVFETPKFKAINIHPSLLPKYRGPAPTTAPILNGDDKTGVTIMQISAGMDEGDILAQKEIKLTGVETTVELEKELAELGGKMLLDLTPSWIVGNIKPQKQNDAEATYTRMIKKEDGKINWQEQTAEEIERMSRALEPWPGVYGFWEGKKINFYDIKTQNIPLAAGKVEVHGSEVLIGTKTGVIIPGFLKIEGKTKVAAADFLRGYPKIIESKLS